MNGKFSAALLSVLSHPLADSENAPDEACTWRTSNEGASGILTCDINKGTLKSFGGPISHASVCPPVRAYAESLLAGVGEGCAVRFDESGVRPDVFQFASPADAGGNRTAFGLGAMSEKTTRRGGMV